MLNSSSNPYVSSALIIKSVFSKKFAELSKGKEYKIHFDDLSESDRFLVIINNGFMISYALLRIVAEYNNQDAFMKIIREEIFIIREFECNDYLMFNYYGCNLEDSLKSIDFVKKNYEIFLKIIEKAYCSLKTQGLEGECPVHISSYKGSIIELYLQYTTPNSLHAIREELGILPKFSLQEIAAKNITDLVRCEEGYNSLKFPRH